VKGGGITWHWWATLRARSEHDHRTMAVRLQNREFGAAAPFIHTQDQIMLQTHPEDEVHVQFVEFDLTMVASGMVERSCPEGFAVILEGTNDEVWINRDSVTHCINVTRPHNSQ